jgi:hypothetical protein
MLDATFFRKLLPWQLVEKALLVAVVLDLAVGGNGYLIQIGWFRLREILYVLCLAWVLLRLTLIHPVRLDTTIVAMVILFIAITALAAALGSATGNQPAAIIAELKPLSYFPMLLFFTVAMRKLEDVSLVALILTAGGLLTGLIYLLILLAAAAGIVDYVRIFRFLHQSDEFIFRHNPNRPFIGFFYKGMFYTCVAAIFLLTDPFRKTKFLGSIAIIAVAMTLTRGLCAALFVCLIAGMTMNRNWRRAPVLVGHAVMLAAILFIALRSETALLIATGDLYPGESIEQPSTAPVPPAVPNTAPAQSPTQQVVPAEPPKTADAAPPDAPTVVNKRKLRPDQIRQYYNQETARPGDIQRLDDIKFVVRHTGFLTTLTGHGLGAPIGSRTRIEQTYVEIFYKQGLLGLAVWMWLFAWSFVLYLRLPAQRRQYGLTFLLSSLFVAVATASNTFLPGSIGMAVTFIALASLLVLCRELAGPVVAEDWYGLRHRNIP